MAQIAVTILDPSNNRSAHLVETRLRVRELIPQIVTRLKLPEQATYELFPLGSEDALPAERTLAESGIPAGAELHLKPVRNKVLKAILDKLYEEAEGYVQEQAWELAKEKLEEILELDPTYPDVRSLEQAVATRAGSLRTTPRAERTTPRTQSTPAGRAPFSASTAKISAARSSSFATSSASSAIPASAPSPAYTLTPQAAKSGAGCVGIGFITITVIVAGAVILGGFFMFPNILGTILERMGNPFTDSVVLGTGDVQTTLRWSGNADLDLHVIDPTGEEISFASPQSTSGGILDVDANGQCEGLSRPVENIYWPTGEAPIGQYQVVVVYYQACGRTEPTDYEVTITIDGDVVNVINAQISTVGERHPVTNFNY